MDRDYKKFFSLALPSILTNLTIPLASIVDLALLGHFSDVKQLGGVALGAIILNSLYWIFSFLRMSTTGLTSIASGEGNKEEIVSLFFRALFLSFVFGLLFWIVQTPLIHASFWLLSGEEVVKSVGIGYTYYGIWGMPFTLAGFAIMGWLLGRQKPLCILYYSTALNGSNIIFDWIFIYKLGWGAQGAGLATMIASILAFILGLFLVRSQWKGLPKINLPAVFQKSNLEKFLNLSGNILVRTFLLMLTFSFFINGSARFSTNLLVANTILLRLFFMASYFSDGFAFALESVVGKYDASGERSKMKKIFHLGIYCNLLVAVVFCGAYLFFSNFVLSLLTKHQEVIEIAQAYLPFSCAVIFVGSVAFILDGMAIGLAKGREMRNSMSLSVLLGFVPFYIWAYTDNYPEALWWGMILFMALRSLSLYKFLKIH